ncbi:hypothetical protein ACVWZZ_006692 [Bradyrhizobium sp. LM6.10]
MTAVSNATENVQKRLPWNKGKIVGAKPPLRPKHVCSIRTKLQVEGRSAMWLSIGVGLVIPCRNTIRSD